MFNKELLQDIEQKAYTKAAGYPYLIALLKQAGVKRYYVDMISHTRTFKLDDDTEFVESGDDDAVIGDHLQVDVFVEALRAHQRGEIDFPTWLAASRGAGCLYYIADLETMKVIYRGGETGEYIEDIPVVSL